MGIEKSELGEFKIEVSLMTGSKNSRILVLALALLLICSDDRTRAQTPSQVYLPHLQTTHREELVKVGQWGGAITSVQDGGEFAFVGHGPRIVVLDLKDRSNPDLILRSPEMAGQVVELRLHGPYLYALISGFGLKTFDVSNAPRLDLISQTEFGDDKPSEGSKIKLRLDRAYVNAGRGIQSVNIEDPGRPTLAGPALSHFWGWPGMPHRYRAWSVDITLEGRTLVVSWLNGDDVESEIVIYDIANPTMMQPIASITRSLNEPARVALKHDRLAIANRRELELFDLRSPADPRLLSRVAAGENENEPGSQSSLIIPSFSVGALCWQDKTVWAMTGDMLYGIDFRNRYRPQLRSEMPFREVPRLNCQDEQLLAVGAEGANNLAWIRASNDREPEIIGEHKGIGPAWNVYFDGTNMVTANRLRHVDNFGISERAYVFQPSAFELPDFEMLEIVSDLALPQIVFGLVDKHLITYEPAPEDPDRRGVIVARPLVDGEGIDVLPAKRISVPRMRTYYRTRATSAESLYLQPYHFEGAPSVYRIEPKAESVQTIDFMASDSEPRQGFSGYLGASGNKIFGSNGRYIWGGEVGDGPGVSFRAQRLGVEFPGYLLADDQRLVLGKDGSNRTPGFTINFDTTDPSALRILEQSHGDEQGWGWGVPAEFYDQRLYTLGGGGLRVFMETYSGHLEPLRAYPYSGRDLAISGTFVAVAEGAMGVSLYEWQ